MILAQGNPVRQMFGWTINLADAIFANWATVSGVLAMGLFAYLAYVLTAQLRDNQDPTLSYESASGAGMTAVSIAGVHVTLMLVGAISLLTWPVAIQKPLFGVVLLGAVVLHYASEKEESRA